MKKILSILVFIGIALSVFADEVVFKANAPSQVIAGRPFQLTYTVNQRCRDLNAPEFTDFDVLAGPYSSTSSSISFVNGRRTSSYEQTYTYTLMAQRTGNFYHRSGKHQGGRLELSIQRCADTGVAGRPTTAADRLSREGTRTTVLAGLAGFTSVLREPLCAHYHYQDQGT